MIALLTLLAHNIARFRSFFLREDPMPTVAAIAAFLEQAAPCRLAEQWDNVGLLVGRRTQDVKKLMTDAELEEKFDLGYHLKHVDTIFGRVFGEAN